MRARHLFALTAFAASIAFAGAGELKILPSPDGKNAFPLNPSDNKAGVKAFSVAVAKDKITVDFKKEPKVDTYIHIDLGHVDLSSFLPGGYVSVEIELDNPIMRAGVLLADFDKFWSDERMSLEADCSLRKGKAEYRFYLENVSKEMAKGENYHLYLFVRDDRKDEPAKASLTVRKISVRPQTPNWAAECDAFYATQYGRKEIRDLNGVYRASYENLVPWDALKSNPSSSAVSLDGPWKRKFMGDLTWNYAALKDVSWAAPNFNDASWEEAKVPEPPAEDQKGGHYVYRKKFKLALNPATKTYLRFNDISQYAEIYVNGKKVASQSSAKRVKSWVIEGGSRHKEVSGKSMKELLAWSSFERCGIPCPFDKSAIPDGEKVLLLPTYSGEFKWPFAMDISSFLVNGENTVALRLYGCPVKGYWVFKERPEDRSFKHVFGILGDVSLLVDALPAIAKLESKPGSVGEDGSYLRNFECKLDASASKGVASVELSVDGGLPVKMTGGSDGVWKAGVKVDADFKTHNAVASALDAESRVIDAKSLSFIGSVFEIRDRALFVNGDKFFARGVNSGAGVEFEGDRKTTRKEWIRQLKFYSSLGFNAIRGEGQGVAEALNAGLMVVPIAAPGSCDNSMMALGNLKNPDYDFATDEHKEMAIFLSSHPNVLMWNIGNEISHTTGCRDREKVEKLIETACASASAFDPAGRPTTFSNLECYDKPLGSDPKGWFFTNAQGIIGMNIYSEVERFRKEAEDFDKTFDRPYVITEWGIEGSDVKATKARSDNIDSWERRMTAKWDFLKTAKPCVGAFLYAHHGEFNDARGKAFIQKLMTPFEAKVAGKELSFVNRDVCPMRDLDVALATDSDVLYPSLHVAELKPGEAASIKLPKDLAGRKDLRFEISYETHRGLKQRFSRPAAVEDVMSMK